MRHLPIVSYRGGIGLLAALGVAGLWIAGLVSLAPRADTPPSPRIPESATVRPVALQPGPPRLNLTGGIDWINTAGPIHAEDLRGKVVVLDFWTYCCINCHHILPDLDQLESKYPNELVVIGVHTAKFPAERETENIRKKVNEYNIKHPVINDANQVLWRRYGVNAWPTVVVFDALGNFNASGSGEGPVKSGALEQRVAELVALHRQRGELDETPLKFFPENEKPHDAPLKYPGKILADAEGDRLFIADTGHNRIVITDRDGRLIDVVGNGGAGLLGGSYDKAMFNRPQGLFLVDEILYVADTENHAIRAIDLEAKQVSLVAGTGEQAMRLRGSGPARQTALSSPWDLILIPGTRTLAIAMAGPHQIWRLDLGAGTVGVWAGTGREDIIDGPISQAAFAQPSGLATDGRFLYVADSEVSGIRAISLGRSPRVRSVVGQGLFEFGDVDGQGSQVRLQHALGVAFGDGTLYIADTYNNKIKVCDPQERTVHTLVGTGESGFSDDPPMFDDPGGLSLAGSLLYVADTNNHAIRVVDLEAGTVRTLRLEGLQAPTPPQQPPRFPNALAIDMPPVQVAPGRQFSLDVTLNLPSGFKVSPEAPMPYLLETPNASDVLAETVSPTGSEVDPPAERFAIPIALAESAEAGESLVVKLSLAAYVCREGAEGICVINSYAWTIPVEFAEGGSSRVSLTTPDP